MTALPEVAVMPASFRPPSRPISRLRRALGPALLLLLAGCTGSEPAAPSATASGSRATREILVVSNNWEGTADFIDPASYERRLRLDVIPDRFERTREILLDPVRLGFFLGIRQLIGEGNDQYVDDSYLSLDGRTLFVSRPSFNDVVAIDLDSKAISWRAPLDGQRADHMAISPDGLRLAVSASTANIVHILDTATGARVGSFESGDSPHENIYSEDGSRIFHASIGLVYTPLDRPLVDTTKGGRVFQVVDAATNTITTRFDIADRLAAFGRPDLSPAIRPMAIAPDERFFYFQLSFFHGFVEYDLVEDRITRLLDLPKITTEPVERYLLDSAHHGLNISGDGARLCAAGTMDGYAAIVDRASFAFTTIPVGDVPYWSTTSADGRTCFVSVAGDDAVVAIDFATATRLAKFAVGNHPQRMRTGRVLSRVLEAPIAPVTVP